MRWFNIGSYCFEPFKDQTRDDYVFLEGQAGVMNSMNYIFDIYPVHGNLNEYI